MTITINYKTIFSRLSHTYACMHNLLHGACLPSIDMDDVFIICHTQHLHYRKVFKGLRSQVSITTLRLNYARRYSTFEISRTRLCIDRGTWCQCWCYKAPYQQQPSYIHTVRRIGFFWVGNFWISTQSCINLLIYCHWATSLGMMLRGFYFMYFWKIRFSI